MSASPDHRELLMEIGSKDSPVSSKSSLSESSSNMSSVNFNLSTVKHQVDVGENGGERSCEKREGDGGSRIEQHLGLVENSAQSLISQSFGKISVQAAINDNRPASGAIEGDRILDSDRNTKVDKSGKSSSSSKSSASL